MTIDQVDLVFGALADSTRRDILRRALSGTEGVAELAAHYPMSFAAVQKHIAILERAGLVTKQVAGKKRLVQTYPAGLSAVHALLDDLEATWRARVERMTDILGAAPNP